MNYDYTLSLGRHTYDLSEYFHPDNPLNFNSLFFAFYQNALKKYLESRSLTNLADYKDTEKRITRRLNNDYNFLKKCLSNIANAKIDLVIEGFEDLEVQFIGINSECIDPNMLVCNYREPIDKMIPNRFNNWYKLYNLINDLLIFEGYWKPSCLVTKDNEVYPYHSIEQVNQIVIGSDLPVDVFKKRFWNYIEVDTISIKSLNIENPFYQISKTMIFQDTMFQARACLEHPIFIKEADRIKQEYTLSIEASEKISKIYTPKELPDKYFPTELVEAWNAGCFDQSVEYKPEHKILLLKSFQNLGIKFLDGKYTKMGGRKRLYGYLIKDLKFKANYIRWDITQKEMGKLIFNNENRFY